MAVSFDITGQRFGRLVALTKPDHRWLCRCDCGAEVLKLSGTLRAGKSNKCTRSCTLGPINSRRTHGDCNRHTGNAPLYNVWLAMKNRCRNPSVRNWHRYGGRGITVCHQWEDYETFKAWALDNGYDETLTIDRIDNDGNYEPSNCRWVSRRIQQNNTRRNHFIEFEGKSMTLADAARKCGLPYSTVAGRIQSGWPADLALTTPKKPGAKMPLRH